MKLTRISAAIALMTLAASASRYAAAQDDPGWYLGVGVGQSRAKIDDPRITGNLASDGLTTTSINDDNRDTGYKLFGGYQFNRYFALEGGYFDLGQFGYQATTSPAGTLNGNIELKGFNLDAVGFIPITDNFSGFGRIGANYAQARDAFSGTGAVVVTDPNPRQHALNYKFGLGLEYRFTQAMAMRLEAERYRIDDAVGNKGDINLLSVGLVYRFGEKSAPPRAVEPVTAAPMPAPEPVVVTPPPPISRPTPPTPTRVTFSADSLFDFNKSVVKPDGQRALDEFSMQLKGTDFDRISVTGHTDRIGSHQYNMKLSTERADAVRDYLVKSGGIPGAKIVAEGVDGLHPVTRPDDCKGNKVTKQLKACLQPDRRVEVEVTGTK